jgi:NAD(P)-dependent dehydrogenase (short-subunit alcohol dehydrogenase family)
MKTVLITGANKGIGLETARQLGKKGFRVVLAGRNAERLEDAQKSLESDRTVVETLLMDVSDMASINKAASNFKVLKYKIDVLINNAGILLKQDSSVLQKEEAVFSQTIETNAFGPLRVTKAFLPYINSPGRIINVSSDGGSMSGAVGGWAPSYCTSKAFLNMITRQMAHELSAQNIIVNAVSPGWVKTDMGGSSAIRTVQQGAETSVWLASEADASFTGQFFMDKKAIAW